MQNLRKQLKNKIINKILELEKVQESYQVFFPIIHFDDRNSLITSPYLSFEVEGTSKVLIIDDGGKKLFFQYREIL
jgi:hypothetical protein